MAAKQASAKAKSKRVFGHQREPVKMFRVGLYARVSTHDQIKEVGSGDAEGIALVL